MSNTVKPQDAQDAESAISQAMALEKTLEIVGQGSKRAIGRAAQWDVTIDLSAMTGVTLYEPAELVLSAKAGTPIAEIEALVAAHNQQLAFEPMDYGPILGLPAGRGSIGGVISANLSGPRRIQAGAARDHFLGFTAVSGRGEIFKSGSRVVKNVTGYDLSKLMAGSWGTLALMTDVTIKVLPRAETEETLVLFGLDDATAGQAMRRAMGSAGEVSAAAHLPAAAVSRLSVARLAADGRAVTALRLEGVPPSIAHRRGLLQTLLGPMGETATLAEAESRMLWQAVRDVTPFAEADSAAPPLWRISVAPSAGPGVAAQLTAETGASVLYDWSGGLIWAQIATPDDAQADAVRRAVAQAGGHATLVRAAAAVRAAVDVFQPQDRVTAMLNRRVKDGFDPKGVLNPGRMYAGV